jgi:hypothetical protein
MRASWRPCLAALAVAAAALFTGAVANVAASASTHHAAALAPDCPAGTNWDGATQSCQ